MRSTRARLALISAVLIAGLTAMCNAFSDGLPNDAWPERDPEVGVWYRLEMRDTIDCSIRLLRVPSEAEAPYFFVATTATPAGLGIGTILKPSPENPATLLGYGRLTPDGNLEFSGDTVNNIVRYERMTEEQYRELGYGCE